MGLLDILKSLVGGQAAQKQANQTPTPAPVVLQKVQPATPSSGFSISNIINSKAKEFEQKATNIAVQNQIKKWATPQQAQASVNDFKNQAIDKATRKAKNDENIKNIQAQIDADNKKNSGLSGFFNNLNESLKQTWRDFYDKGILNTIGEAADKNNHTLVRTGVDNLNDIGSAIGDDINNKVAAYKKRSETGAQDIFRNNIITNSLGAIKDTFRDAQWKYDEDKSNRNSLLDLVGSVANAPTNIIEGVDMAGGKDKSLSDRAAGLIKTGMGVTVLIPQAAVFGAGFDTLMPTDWKKTINDSVGWLNDDIKKQGMKLGMNENDAKNVADIIYGGASIAATLLGVKAGNSVGSAVSKSIGGDIGKVAGKVAGTGTSFGIQASPDIVPLVWQAYKDSKDNNNGHANKDALIGQMVFNAATMLPLAGITKAGFSRKHFEELGKTIQDVAETKPTLNQLTDTKQVIHDVLADKPPQEIKANIAANTTLEPSHKQTLNNFVDNFSKETTDPVEQQSNKLSDKIKEWEVNKSQDTPDTNGKNLAELFSEQDAEKKIKEQTAPTTPVKRTLDWQEQPKSQLVTDIENTMNSFKPGDAIAGTSTLSKVDQTAGRFGTIKWSLDKVQFDIPGKWRILLGDLVQGMYDSGTRYGRLILDSAGIKKWDEKLVSGRKFEVTEDMITGWVTPNEKKIITPEIAKHQMEIIKNPLESMPDNLREYIGTMTKQQKADFENLIRAEMVYQLQKDNPENLQRIFTPEEIQQFQQREAANAKVYNDMKWLLVEKGLLNEHLAKDEDYTRFVASKYGRDFLENSWKVTLDVRGKKLEFDNIGEAQAAVQSKTALNSPLAHDYEKAFASVLKEKAENYDAFRMHSPTLQMMSYALDIGKTLKNKSILDTFRNITKAEWQLTPEQIQAKEVIGNLSPDTVNQILDIHVKDNSMGGKAYGAIASTTRATSLAMLAGRVHLFSQALISAGGKATIERTIQWVKNTMAGRSGVNYVTNRLTPESAEIMTSFWYSPDTISFADSTKAGWKLERSAAFISGAPIDVVSKRIVAVNQMKIDMDNAGLRIESKNPNDVIKAYDEWSRDPKNKDAFLASHATIQGKLNGIGGSTWATQSNIDVARKLNLFALKGYVMWQVNRAKQDIADVFSKHTSGSQKADALQRQAQAFMVWGATALAAAEYMSKDNPDMDEEQKMDIAKKYATDYIGLPPTHMVDLIKWATGSPFFAALNLGTSATAAGYKTAIGSPDWKIQLDNAAVQLINLVGASRAANIGSKRGLTDIIADKIGTVNVDRIDNYGRTKAHNDWGIAAVVFGFMPEKLTEDLLQKSMDEVLQTVRDKDKNLNVFGKNLAPIRAIGTDFFNSWTRPMQWALNAIAWDVVKFDMVRAQQIHDTYRDITIDDSIPSFFKKQWIELDEVSKNLIANAIIWASVNTRKTNAQWAVQLNSTGRQFMSDGKLWEYMEKLNKEDPYTFSKVITGLYTITQKAHDMNKNSITSASDLLFRDVIKNSFTENKNDIAVLDAIKKDTGLTTRISQNFYKNITEIIKADPRPEAVKAGFAAVDSFFKKVDWFANYNAGIKKSIEAESDALIETVEHLKKYMPPKDVLDIVRWLPIVGTYIQNGMRWRWWRMDENGSLQIPGKENSNTNTWAKWVNLSNLIQGGQGTGEWTGKWAWVPLTWMGNWKRGLSVSSPKAIMAKQSHFKSLYDLIKDPNIKLK